MRSYPNLKKSIHSGWFEYFYWIFMVVFIVISALGAALYFYFSSLLRNDAIIQNTNTLNQLKNAQEAMLAETNRSISGIVLDSVIINYMEYYYVKDNNMMLAAQSKIETVCDLHNNVDSVYVYYRNDDVVLSSDEGAVKSDRYYDAPFIAELEKIKANTAMARVKSNPDGTQKIDVVSFINTYPILVTNKGPISLVVYNLKSEALQQSMDSIKMSDHSTILITNHDGSIISRKAGNADGVDEFLIDEIKKRNAAASGSVSLSYKGEKFLVSYVNSDSYSWRYIYITPMSAITAKIRFLAVITILFCSLMVVLSLLGSFFVSKKLYSPIKAALALFSPGMPEREVRGNGTALLQTNIDSMLRKNKNLEELLKDYDAYQKNNFLLKLLSNSYEPDEKLADRLTYYQVCLDENGKFVTIEISVDHYNEISAQYSEKQLNMLSIYIRENITGKILEKHKGFFAGEGESNFFLVINFSQMYAAEQIKNELENIVTIIRNLVSRNFHFTFTIGISLPCEGIENLHKSYEEAVMAVNHRLLIGYNNVIFYGNIVENQSEVVCYPFSVEKKILDAVKSGCQGDIFRFLNDFTDTISEMRSEDIELVRYYFLQLFSASVKCFYEIDRSYSAGFMQKEYYTAFFKKETIHEMFALMKSLYSDFLNYMAQLRNERCMDNERESLLSITDFICCHLDSDLSIDLLEEKFSLSAYQLRKLFKDGLGVSPKDYIDGLKMKKAAELLCTTTLTIGKIAENVGYFSIPSFTRAFKTSTGMTPGEYRRNSEQ